MVILHPKGTDVFWLFQLKGWVKMEREYYFYAYHGTFERYASSIIRTRRFKPGSMRRDHWLGQGIYFYREDIEQARLWAKYKIKKYPCERPSVIEVTIRTREANFLNLDTRSGMSSLAFFIEKLEKEGLIIKIRHDNSSQEKTRCYIMSLLPDSIWIIQRTFEVKSMFDRSKYFTTMGLRLLGTQVCIRNHCVIQSDSIKLVL
jgi:hypothetical protein